MKMNRILLHGLLAGMLCSAGNLMYAQSPWQPLGVSDGMVNSSSDYSSIAVDTNNVPFVAYSDLTDGSKLKVKKFDGTGWLDVGTNPSDGSAIYMVMKIDKANVPHVLFRDGSAGSTKLTLRKFDGTAWVNVGVAKFTPGNSALPDLAFGPDNLPYVSFVNYATGANGKATVMKYDGTAWQMMGTPMSSGAAGLTQVSVDASGLVYCAYTDAAQGGWVNVKKFVNNDWVLVGNSVTASASKNLSLALKSDGTPVVGYSDAASIEKMSVKEYDGTAWVNIGAAGFSVSQVGESGYAAQYRYAVMTLGRDDKPIVAYTDLDSSYYMTVMRYDGAAWSVLGVQPAAQHRAKCIGLAVDKTNAVYGSYTASPTGNTGPWPNYAIKYELCETLVGAEATAHAVCFGDTVNLTVTGSLGSATGWEWTTGSCNGTVIGTGASLEVIPAQNTTYYVKAINGCAATCESVSVTVTHLEPVIAHQAANGMYTLSVSGGTFATYQWYRNGTSIPGATSASYVTDILAVYTVEVTGGDCTVMSDAYNLTEIVSVAGHNNFRDQVKIFPNPAAGQLNITVPAAAKAQVFSVHGKMMMTVPVQKGNNTIDITGLPAAGYLIHFTDKNGLRTGSLPFVKQ